MPTTSSSLARSIDPEVTKPTPTTPLRWRHDPYTWDSPATVVASPTTSRAPATEIHRPLSAEVSKSSTALEEDLTLAPMDVTVVTKCRRCVCRSWTLCEIGDVVLFEGFGGGIDAGTVVDVSHSPPTARDQRGTSSTDSNRRRSSSNQSTDRPMILRIASEDDVQWYYHTLSNAESSVLTFLMEMPRRTPVTTPVLAKDPRYSAARPFEVVDVEVQYDGTLVYVFCRYGADGAERNDATALVTERFGCGVWWVDVGRGHRRRPMRRAVLA